MKHILLAALLIAGSALPAGAASVSRSYSYFNIDGKTLDEIESQLSSRGPQVNSTGKRHPGATQMEFTSRVGYRQVKNGCEIVSAKVNVQAKIILPRWRQRKKAEPDIRLIWDTLSSDIKRHEESHTGIAKNYARELEQALKAIGKQKTCEIATAKVKSTTDKILKRHDLAQVEYDRVEGINFESRIVRLLRYRLDRIEAGKLPG